MGVPFLSMAHTFYPEQNLRRGPFSYRFDGWGIGRYGIGMAVLQVVPVPYFTLLKVSPSRIGNRTVSNKGCSLNFLL